MAIYACDAQGRMLWFNRHAAELWGRKPRLNDDSEKYCGSLRCYFDGREISRDETPMACVLRTGIPIRGAEGKIQRPDGTFVWTMVHIEPVKDEHGSLVGAINCFHETTTAHPTAGALARCTQQQAALFEFTADLQRATTLDDIYQLGITAILRALSCQRASILIFDNAGTMRFVASRGLSETYRRAVDGHSPWSRDTLEPTPIYCDDIDRADLPESLKQIVRREGIGALAFVPLCEGGKLLGKFMAYYDEPHAFAQAEVELALTIARQLGLGIERVRSETARSHAALASQWLASIVESSDDAIVSKNLDGIILTWNRGAERIFGYSADEVIGKPVTILMPPDRVDEEPEILARIRRGEPIDHYETVRQRKDGTLLDVSLTVSPVRDDSGRIIGASKIARDITDRKRAEAQLRNSERQLQDLLAAIPAAIYTTDVNGKITYFNEAAVALAGRTPTIGTDEWCVTWKLYHPDGTPLPHDQCPMAVALKEGRAIRNAEAIAERPDGTRVPFIPYPTPLRDEKGRIIGAINMLVDISERRQAETQQQILLKELNHRVKNNMQTLQSLLHMAALQTQNAEARKVLSDATSRVTAMAAAQRVFYSTANATEFEVDELVRSVCDAVGQTLPPHINITCESDAGRLSNEDAMPLALILNELLTNAAKYGFNGGQGTIRVEMKNDAGAFVLAVEDDGPGFDLQSIRRNSSGLRLVDGLARQLRGKFDVSGGSPARCTLHFS